MRALLMFTFAYLCVCVKCLLEDLLVRPLKDGAVMVHIQYEVRPLGTLAFFFVALTP